MSATKLDKSGVFSPAASSAGGATVLNLSPNTYRISKNGIEFQTRNAISDWTEMTIELQSANGGAPVKCNGVVVGCHGTAQTGYSVSMVFTNLSPQSEAGLEQLG